MRINMTMRFSNFLEEVKHHFVVRDVEIEICEVPMASHEQMLLERAEPELLNFIRDRVTHFAQQVRGMAKPQQALPEPEPEDKFKLEPGPEENLRKFKVSLRYPRSKRKEWLGHYVKDTMYVYAKSVNDAKRRAEEYIRYKLEPVENDESRRFPKYNYLKNVKRKHLDMQVQRVNNWNDLVATLRHISTHRGELTPLDYLDENDLKIILKTAKSKNFLDLLKRLKPNEQKLLKRFYFHMAQSPWLDGETKAMLGAIEPTMRMLGGKKVPYEREPGDDDEEIDPMQPTDPDWSYWSVREPKTQAEIDKLIEKISTVRDVFEIGRRFGISPKELRAVKDSLFKAEDEYIGHQKELFNFLRKQLKVSPNNLIFQTDYANPLWAKKYGVNWDELVENLLTSREGYANALPFTDDADPDSTVTKEKAANWIWHFYQRGMPRKKKPLEQLEAALKHVLEYRERIKSKKRPDENVPF